MTASPSTPRGLSAAGRRLWKSVLDTYELDQHEELLLLQAARTADRLEDIATGLVGEPLTVSNARGDLVAHPLLNEQRQQALTLSRLLASLRLPSGDEAERPQRRGGARAPYGIRGAV